MLVLHAIHVHVHVAVEEALKTKNLAGMTNLLAFSRFSKCFELDDAIALYHSLRMKPVYIKKAQYSEILGLLDLGTMEDINDFPSSLRQEVEELCKYKILTKSKEEDVNVLNFVRSKIPAPAVNVCYFILSEQCNLACKYCFLGNNAPEKRQKFSQENMTKETAEKALAFFIRQLKLAGNIDPENKPTIIFYGGEPLLNFEVLEYVAQRVEKLKETEPCLENADLSVITNGVLLTSSKLKRLKELGISIAISIDGCTEEANELRIDVAGKPSFNRVLKALDTAKKEDVDVSLSVTLTEKTIKDKAKILELISDYNIKGFGFNILMSDENFTVSEQYSEAAADFIIDVFRDLRDIGIYEDRIMRKLKAFAKSQVYFSDCAATAGSQVVITPDGSVGICHGCLADRDYFVSSIEDEDFNANTHPVFTEWSQLTPVNREECLDCEALGICGGGCPINALYSKPDNTISSLDERFCIHAKRTLEFLIKDLYRIISKEDG